MTASQFVSAMATVAVAVSPTQRRLIWRFAASLVEHGGLALAHADEDRREMERVWEELQLATTGNGLEAARRAREPS